MKCPHCGRDSDEKTDEQRKAAIRVEIEKLQNKLNGLNKYGEVPTIGDPHYDI